MSLIKFILLLALGGMVFHYWQDHNAEQQTDVNYISENGFITIPKPANFQADSVIVLAAKNCSKAAAKRADLLVEELQRNDIPYTRAHRVDFSGFDPSLKNRLDSVLRGELPIVLFDGRGKANPTLSEVVAEYNSVYE